MRTKQEAIALLKQAEKLREVAQEIVNDVLENSPSGEYKDLWTLLMCQFESAESAIKESRIYP